MDFVKECAAGALLLTVELTGTISTALGVLPLPHTPQAWGEMLAWFVLYVVLRLRDRGRVARRVRAHIAKIKAVKPEAVLVVPADEVSNC